MILGLVHGRLRIGTHWGHTVAHPIHRRAEARQCGCPQLALGAHQADEMTLSGTVFCRATATLVHREGKAEREGTDVMLGAAWELDRRREGEYHVRTDFLAESTLMGGAVILMIGERREGHVYLAHHHVVACASSDWHMEDTPGQLPAGCSGLAVGHPPALEVPVKPFLCHWVIHVIELPPPGNLSDWTPRIFISA